MPKIEKMGSDVWFDMKAGDELRLRLGPVLSWIGSKETLTVSPEKAIGAGIKNGALGLPLIESRIQCNAPTRLLTKIGTKVEIWKVELDDTPVYFKGAFYLGHQGDVTLNTRNPGGMNFIFMIEPKGVGTIYLALPKTTMKLPMDAKMICMPYDRIAIITGDPSFRTETIKSDLKNIRKKGFWARTTSCEITNHEELYIYGGTVKGLFSGSSDDDED